MNVIKNIKNYFGWTEEKKKPIEFGYNKPINLNISSKIYQLKNSNFDNYNEGYYD